MALDYQATSKKITDAVGGALPLRGRRAYRNPHKIRRKDLYKRKKM